MVRASASIAIVIASLALSPDAAAAGWSWPLRGPVLDGFRFGADPFAPGQSRGIRIGAAVGATVRSACPGRVRFAGSAGTSGRTVSVECGRYTASYLHMSSVAVRRGERLRPGERVGEVGVTGRPRLAQPHLYFGVRRTGRRWAYVDPLALLPRSAGAPPPIAAPPARRGPRATPLGPTPKALPRGATRWVTPRRSPLGTPTLPLAAWLGLAALATALAAAPVRRARRRRRAPAVRPRFASRGGW